MARKKTSKKRKFSIYDLPIVKLKNPKDVRPHNARVRLRDKGRIAQALWECLVANEIDAFKEILRAHIEVTKKDDLAKKAGISRRTLFRMLSPSGNPTLENLG